jgi:hypothetical protein
MRPSEKVVPTYDDGQRPSEEKSTPGDFYDDGRMSMRPSERIVSTIHDDSRVNLIIFTNYTIGLSLQFFAEKLQYHNICNNTLFKKDQFQQMEKKLDYVAIKNGDLEAIKSRPFDPIYITIAAKTGQVKFLDYFYDLSKSSLHVLDEHFKKVLYLGVANNRMEVVRFAVENVLFTHRELIRAIVKSANNFFGEIAIFLIDIYGYMCFPKKLLPAYFALVCEVEQIMREHKSTISKSEIYYFRHTCYGGQYFLDLDFRKFVTFITKTYPLDKIKNIYYRCDFKYIFNSANCLSVAVQRKDLSILKFFVENTACNPDYNGSYALHVALDCNFTAGFEYLAKFCANNCPYIVSKAFETGSLEKIKLVGNSLTHQLKRYLCASSPSFFRRDDVDLMRYLSEKDIEFNVSSIKYFFQSYVININILKYLFSVYSTKDKIMCIRTCSSYEHPRKIKLVSTLLNNLNQKIQLKKYLHKNQLLKFVLKPKSLHMQTIFIG